MQKPSEMDSGLKLWNRSYIMLLIMSTVSSTGFYMIQPTLAGYAVSLGASRTIAGVLSGIFSMTALVMRPLSGSIADRINKKWLMAISTGIIAISSFGYSIVDGIPVLLVFRIFHGLAFAISGTVNVSMAASFVPMERMGEGIGYLGIGSIISTSLGPNIGLMISERYGYPACFMIAAGFELITAIGMAVFPYHTAPTEVVNRRRFSFRELISPTCIPLALFAMVFSVGNGLVNTYLALMAEERGILSFGMYYTVSAITLFLIRPVFGKLNDKKGLSWVIVPAYLLQVAAMLLLAGATTTWMIVLAGFFKAISVGGGQPALQAECIKRVGKKKSGVAVSTYYVGCDVGNGFGPMVGGEIASVSGYGSMFFSCGMMAVIALMAYACYCLFPGGRKNNNEVGNV